MPTYTAPGVYVEEIPSSQKVLSSAPTAVTAFVGFTASAPSDDPADPQGLAPRLVTSWTQYEALYGGFADGAMLPLSVYGYFLNGGTQAYIVRVAHAEPSGKPATLELPAADRALGLPIAVESVEPDAQLSVVVQTDDAPDDLEGPTTFTLVVLDGGEAVEEYPGLSLGGPRDAATVVNKTSTKVKLEIRLDEATDLSSQLELLRPGTYALQQAEPVKVPVTGRKFAGSEAARTGINGLAIAEDVTIVVVPDLVTAATREDGTLDLGLWKAVQTSLIAHCEQHANRMALLDAPPGMTPQQVKEWRSEVAQYDSAFATMYYPWIKVENPLGSGASAEIVVPPSGHVAGVWARTDETRGVWKAPANDTIRGVLDVERSVTQTEQGFLNPIGVNAIRPFGTRGIRIWGARTLASDTDWQYVNVRRLFNMVESTILEGTQWAVFEPNDVTLWEGVKRTLTGYLHGLWQSGALFGSTADQAFFVRCDETTNTPESIDAGRLIVEVGLAPVKPAEFVVFRISQNKQSAA
ncbi:phage tail sheath family protein [Cellulomonas wangsupingiae]|uniref:Phage tail sheath subtilisin-like domain-containing protein n=1 Tax=Cellulomonas wangsupingiae TaxID=2968085 RepID=A0ABY5K2I3_9CELL|nr:phage tail sheath subtilisin-like domain-containing protein [Cellulomonas wangsupingiae]MCC2336471.1 phage tail sheath subtilisin-like domain-containing protein [Cellulomonas wangsupingiae]MCM0640839.1 phage tail sheath subtilisin-like domain-containing protein [Cellulomonas wangsupingiae]UUI64651.1 phage tail sheath subtilisin-like domain-containing protein [Cellulomonas wangsupingiae]